MTTAQSKQTTILIIDDEDAVRNSLCVYLEDSGFNILEAADARQGLTLFDQELPDLILLDLRMPEMDGLDFLAQIHERSPDTPVIVVSGAGVLEDAIGALRLGALDFVTKPILDMAMLENSIQRALERTQLIQENRQYRQHLEDEIQKRTEALEKRTEALKNSEAQFRELTDLLPQPVFEIDLSGRFLFTNQYGLKIFGYTQSDIEAGLTAQDVIAKPDRVRILADIQKTIEGNKVQSNEYLARRKDGTCFPVIIYSNAVVRREQVVGLRGVIFDLTHIKRTEKALRESQARLSVIIEVFEGFIYTCTNDYRITFNNKKMIKRIGRDALGEICYNAYYGRHEPCPWCDMPRIFEGEIVRREFNNPMDGRWYYAVNTPIQNTEGRIVQRQAIVIDINDRKLAEEALRISEVHLREENLRLKSSLQGSNRFGRLIGKSAVMRHVYDVILKASESNANIIIYGESGTGKEIVAATIHELSNRHQKKFIPVHCAAIPENLIESEFFGYKKGAFTGAQADKPGLLQNAHGGTLFLDEIGEINLNMQVKLLRAIAGDGFTPIGGDELIKCDIRIIAATNQDLKKQVAAGTMREDFFYRIHIIPIYMPPLRDRREDIPLLIHHFLQKYAENGTSAVIPPNVIKSMQQQQWRGNIRELENTIHRFITLKEFDQPMPQINQGDKPAALPDFFPEVGTSLKEVTQSIEKKYILHLLETHQWNRTKIAAILGVDRRTLFRKIKTLGIE